MRHKKTNKNILLVCAVLFFVLVFLYCGIRLIESSLWPAVNDETIEYVSKTITRDDIDYYPRQDITVVMVLGIDQYGPVASSGYYRNSGSADSIMLFIFDDTEKNCSVLYLNRDTMVDVNVLGIKGESAGTVYSQLALAHTYGTGMEDSCVNVKETLENYFHGLTIDYYVAMNMDAIPILNDAVGGVTVTVVDDFSKVNPSITMGELTLKGDQVIDFVRTRKDVGDQKNVTRMERQKEYVDNFLKALYQKEHEDINFVVNVYEDVAPYIVTDCSVETLSNLLNRYVDFSIKEVLSPAGENIVAGGHYEFYADEDELDELILSVFYRPKDRMILPLG